MYSARYGDLLAVRLEAGEEIPAALVELCRAREVRAAFVGHAIGALDDPELGYYVADGKYESRRFPGRFECLGVSGNVSLKDGGLTAHLHAMLSDTDYRVFGGHLLHATVGVTLEAQLSVVGEPVRMYRELEPATGLYGLLIE